MPIPLLLMLIATSATSPQPPPAQPAAPSAPNSERKCMSLGPQIAAILRKGVRPQRLDELPPGRLELTVLREVDGCPQPAVIRENIGPVPLRR